MVSSVLSPSQAAYEMQLHPDWDLSPSNVMSPQMWAQIQAELKSAASFSNAVSGGAPVVTAAGTPIGAAANPSTTMPVSTSWFDGSTSVAGITLPNMGVAAGVGVLALLLLMRHKR